ncbi:MAG: hypothetical protein ACRC8S_22245 [Fimbriiglobus sp.]
MRSLLLMLGLVGLFAMGSDAQDAPKAKQKLTAKTTAELLVFQEEFLEQHGKATTKLSQAFAEQEKKIKNSTAKVDVQVKALKELQTEKENFEKKRELPKSTFMKAAVTEFSGKIQAAKTKCEAGFQKVATAFRDKKDFDSASAVLEKLTEFLDTVLGKPDTRFYWVGKTRKLICDPDTKNWTLEYKGKFFTFKEIARTEQYVEMFDNTRTKAGEYVRLNNIRLYKRTGDEEKYLYYDEGTWEPLPKK